MKQIFFYDFYEKNTIRHLLSLLSKTKNKPLTCVDVGTNIGFYTFTIDKALEGVEHHIHCFEPNPSTFETLTKNLTSNPSNQITLNPFGLSDKEGTFTLTYNLQNTGTASIYKNSKSGNKVEIKVKTLDQYCEEKNIKNVDLIKVDIEGAEFDFLKGAKKIIDNSNELIIIMEIVEDNCIAAGYTAKEIYQYVINLGFKAYLPKSWPFGLRRVDELPDNYHDNIVFIKS
ncbi:MAG: FkbM family methyltransferase [Flavobacteriales bacterium]|nr:FkbM family methyltransferase [Flavobacteriales bacterium]